MTHHYWRESNTKANNIIASESNKGVEVSSNYSKNPLGYNNIESKNEIDWLWCETCSATCSCSHHLIDHTRNDGLTMAEKVETKTGGKHHSESL